MSAVMAIRHGRNFILRHLKPPQFSSQPTKRFKIVSNAKLKNKLKYTFTHPDPLKFK